ncbi:MAG: mandelate racemase/muconate lactonizing enzyme family protein, partial [Proteobacteria bacterium]|nr:mandelate racemase/muconate lactonizing enzyme family protein [Pseudomonadota bacterium]
MSNITRVEVSLVNLMPKVKRTDAIQSFVSQETPIVVIYDDEGQSGVGYTYTIGTGGSSVVSLLTDHLLPQIIGRDADMIENIWNDLKFFTHATTVGAITSLALAAIDTALWDLKCKRAKQPLHKMAGGAKSKVPVYSTEGGWLHIEPEALVEDALKIKEEGFKGAKIKVGKPHVSQDLKRLAAVRDAVGDEWEIMTDCNQSLTVDEAVRRARYFEELNIAWFEEPLPADDLNGHIRLSRSTSVPIAVGESIYSMRHFKEYMQQNAASIIQVDVARIGGITPWLKVAHTAEAFDMPVCPHFLMELHISLTCAVPNGRWLEYIPQLDSLTHSQIEIEQGYAYAPKEIGLGINWDWDQIK